MSTWNRLVAKVLELPPDEVAPAAERASFLTMGGDSVRAAELSALAVRELGLRPDLGRLLSSEPLRAVLDAAESHEPLAMPEPDRGRDRALLPGQHTMLTLDEVQGGTAYSATISGSSERWAA